MFKSALQPQDVKRKYELLGGGVPAVGMFLGEVGGKGGWVMGSNVCDSIGR